MSRKAVIIEDNIDAASTLAKFLELLGFDVRVAHDGRAGVDTVVNFLPQFVLCDIGLPELNGYEVAESLRLLESTKSVRLIAISGYARDEDRARSAEAGFEKHLAKPVDLDELEALLAG